MGNGQAAAALRLGFLIMLCAVLAIPAFAAETPPNCFDSPPLVFDEPTGESGSMTTPEPTETIPACGNVEPLSQVPMKSVGFESQCNPKGWVSIAFVVTESGQVSDTHLEGVRVNQGNRGWAFAFAEQAIDSVRQWRFPRRDAPCSALRKFSFEAGEPTGVSEGSTAQQ